MTHTPSRTSRSRAAATTSTLALVNQTAILDALKTSGPMSKVQLGEATGLSPATVNRITAALMADGLVEHRGVEASTGGRPPIVLAFVGSARVVAAVQIHSEEITGALVDFEGVVVERVDRALPAGSPPQGLAVYRSVLDELERLGRERGTPPLAVGVSVTGIVTPDSVVSGLDPARWAELNVTDLSEGRDVDVIVENDANALAIGELHRGIGRDSPNFVTLLLERGLGAGIVTNGSVYRGHNSAAGEIGFLLVESSSFGKRFEESGDLETRLGAATITRLADEEGIPHSGSIGAMELIALARSGDERALPLASRVLDDVARAVGAIASILDPQTIVLGEGLDRESDFVAPALRSRLEGRIQRVPVIATASLGADAVLLGAAEMAVRAAGRYAYLA
ncbi:ROK family transcriptional regulator [Labedella populi]|uniref:ROK family transcriptional regulator n=1 Tax=Labedella populi TaxID=2498850 RepID=A0A3S4EC00_9MICO|nr:ROK family transcriptional regulator [Labedella populi]RWZ67801.1 ROK family transcriptional regulator [Labedella populi]